VWLRLQRRIAQAMSQPKKDLPASSSTSFARVSEETAASKHLNRRERLRNLSGSTLEAWKCREL